MYRETLIDQWKNLYSDFAGEYERLQHQGDATAAFNRWYEARVHRWNSITYSEGILLEQENNPAFSTNLRLVLQNFRFHSVKPQTGQPVWIGIAASALGGGIATGTLLLFHWGEIKAIISGAALFVVIAAAFSKKNADSKKLEQKRVKEAYIQQLKDYQSELIAICNKYDMNP